jgi:DNA-binding response OmpR family regulator
MDQDVQRLLMLTYKLTPKLAELPASLLRQVVVPIEATDPVLVHRLRKEMKPHGIVICTRRWLGYQLSDQDRQTIRAAMGASEQVCPHCGKAIEQQEN